MTEEAKKIEEEIKGKPEEGKKQEEQADERSPEQKIIDELQGKLKEANDRAQAAELARADERRQRDAARSEAKTAGERQLETQENALKTAVEGTKSKFEAARREWREARDSGDTAKEEDALIKVNDAQMEMRSAEIRQAQFEEWKKTRKTERVDDGLQEFRVATGDTLRLPPSAVEWMKKHPEFQSNPSAVYALYGENDKARGQGIEMFSNAHYDFLDKKLEEQGFINKQEPKQEPQQQKKSEKQSTAAPPANSGSGAGSGAKKNTITLTPEERRTVAIVFPDEHKKNPEEAEKKYAAYKLKIKEGK